MKISRCFVKKFVTKYMSLEIQRFNQTIHEEQTLQPTNSNNGKQIVDSKGPSLETGWVMPRGRCD